MSAIETFLTGFRRQLPAGRAVQSRLAHEVEDHLLTLADQLEAGGLSRDQAEREAVARFGSPGEVAAIAREIADEQARTSTARAWRALVVLATLATAVVVVVESLPDETLAPMVLKVGLLAVMAVAGLLAVARPHAAVTGAGAVAVASVGLVVVLSYEMSFTSVWPAFGTCFRTIGGLLVLQGGLCAAGAALRPVRT